MDIAGIPVIRYAKRMKTLHVSPQIPVVIDPNCPPGIAFLIDLAPKQPVECQLCGYSVDDEGFCSFCGHTNRQLPLQRVIFKASEAEYEAWKEAAWSNRLTFSAWARNMLNGVAVFEPPEEKKAPERAPKPDSGCMRRLTKGTFCKHCEKVH